MKIYLTDIHNKKMPEDKLFLLSERGKKNYEAYKNAPKRALQAAVGDLLIKKAIFCAALQNSPESGLKNENTFEPQKLLIEQTPSGKPFIKGAADFSLSHSENVVALAVAGEGEQGAGLDVQLLKEPLSPALIRGALSQEEQSLLNEIQNEPDRVKYFYRLYTEKESYVKFTGEGLTKFPREITNFLGAKFLTKYVFRQNELYCLTVCSKNILSIKIIVTPFEQLFS